MTEPSRTAAQQLSSETYVVMVWQQFVDRILSYFGADMERVKILEYVPFHNKTHGLVLVLVPSMRRPFNNASVSPMARQHISWVGRVQFSLLTTMTQLPILCDTVWETRPLNMQRLRVQCHPKHMNDRVVDMLFVLAKQDNVEMVRGSARCTDQLTIIKVPNSNVYYWGWESRPKAAGSGSTFDLRLNHYATDDLQIVSSNSRTGKDIRVVSDRTAPVSRAYWKLRQIWEENLRNETGLDWKAIAAVDIGAAPGGWVQVLLNDIGVSNIYAVDPAVLADRVAKPGVVHHFRCKFDQVDWSLLTQRPSLLVCDACLCWSDLFDWIVPVFEAIEWELPVTVILTLKLPFKSPGSIQRHMGRVQKRLPTFLQTLSTAMFQRQVPMRQSILHLLANSESERTLLAFFG